MAQDTRVGVEHWRNIVIGSGEGGKYLAWHLGRSGEQVLVIERRYIGGSCPNINCLPAKNEIWSAKVASLASHGKEFGAVTGTVSVDMARVVARKREMVEGLIAIHLNNYKTSGVQLVMGGSEIHLSEND